MLKLEYYFSYLVKKLAVVSLFFLLTTQNALANSQNLDNRVARSYLTQAKQAYEQEKYKEVAVLLEQSAEFANSYGDYHFLKGLLLLTQERYRLALHEIEHSLNLYQKDNLFGRHAIINNLIPLYYRLKAYDAIVGLYESNASSLDETVVFYYLLALQNRGDSEKLIASADSLTRRYPNDFRLYFALFSLDMMQTNYLERFRFLSFEPLTQTLTQTERSIFLASIKRVADDDLRKDILNISYHWLSNDENYNLYAAKNDLLLPALEGNLVASLYKEFDPDQVANYTARIANGDRLLLGIDTDLDGFPDQVAELTANKSYWAYDLKQDGNYQYKINLEQGRITTLEERRGEQLVHWAFSSFPSIKTVDLSTVRYPAGRLVQYHLLPNRLKIDTSASQVIIEGWTPIPLFTPQSSLPLEWKLLTDSYQLDEYIDAKPFRKMNITDGKVTMIMEDSVGDGYFDHLMVIEDWKVVYGKRDIDRRGNFDLYEYYEDGIWQGLAYAPDGDGKISYYEDWHRQQIKLWDFNKDSFINGYSLMPQGSRDVTIQPNDMGRLQAKEFLSWDFSNSERWFDGLSQ